jgi:D-alanyl-D-alanine-carboxypeptidase/D-alanyl-D-alanine-endopeptidase
MRIAKHIGFAATVLAGLMMIPPAGAQTVIALPSDTAISKMLADRVDTLAGVEDGIGIVVGVVGPQGRSVISYGHLNQGDGRPLNGDTDFEIGSVSKVFTALLLADMVHKGEVSLADPVAKYLPAGVKIPERNGHSITLLDLATHTSGLPFMPDELPAPNDSAAKHSTALLYQFLAHYKLTRDPGVEWDYSNVGYWLLGQALATRAGTDYETLLQTRVISPLRLTGTANTPSPNMKAISRWATTPFCSRRRPLPASRSMPTWPRQAVWSQPSTTC